MRLRFFSIIFFVLLTVGVASSLLYNYFLHQDRITLIDQQVRETATALLGSELGGLSKIDIPKAEEIISDELGENRIGKFFILRKKDGVVLYESLGAKILPIKEVPQSPQWITIREKGQYIRILNLQLPRIPNRTLQVGLVIGEDILSPPYISRNTTIYIFSTVLIGLLISFFLTSILLRPITKLSEFLSHLNSRKEGPTLLPSLPSSLYKYPSLRIKDEYIVLLNCLDSLIERVNKGYKTSRSWSYQMAHELKTPLTIMETDLEIGIREAKINHDLAQDIRTEIKNVSNTISTFLNWAEIENIKEPKYSQSISVARVLNDFYRRLSKAYPNRISLTVIHDFKINCTPQHFELLIQNIIFNSIKYTPLKSIIHIQLNSGLIKISDNGSGIPINVLNRIGEPFNFNSTNSDISHGSGLGLAFVYSIAGLYNWKIDLASDSNGTIFKITFPETELQLKPSDTINPSCNSEQII